MTEQVDWLEVAFTYADVESADVIKLVTRVLEVASHHVNFEEAKLGRLHDQPTYSGELAEVEEGGDINVDGKRLLQIDRDIAQAMLAHEFAHRVLGHHRIAATAGLKEEKEADDLARKWGFDIDKFRRACGAPTEDPTRRRG